MPQKKKLSWAETYGPTETHNFYISQTFIVADGQLKTFANMVRGRPVLKILKYNRRKDCFM